jgi:hypothetical protein
MYLKKECLPINFNKKYKVCDLLLLNNNIRSALPNKFRFRRFQLWLIAGFNFF